MASVTTCATGHAAPVETGGLCRYCAATVYMALTQVPDLLRELEVTTTRQARQAAPARGASGGPRPLVFNAASAGLADELTALLCRAVATPGRTQASALTAHAAAAELYAHLPRYAHPGAEWPARLLHLRERGYAAVDRAPDVRVLGMCDCGAPLRTGRTSGALRCRSCTAEYDITALVEARIRAVEDRWVTPREAVALFEVLGVKLPESTVRTWGKRRELHPITREPTRYVLGDVLRTWETHNGPLPGRPVDHTTDTPEEGTTTS